ncbi:hypothetical protein D9758_017263 [Tetrapyrgos nigripes]|uniref:Uncharacterized protein n=1 Tax=Tetrapyrgos nigripes TaxID=182062 RepID=A0A8H5C5E1_9AGAR|nr:hypothetical protein D9758_017263 [Tetrapyrgos nigripes]
MFFLYFSTLATFQHLDKLGGAALQQSQHQQLPHDDDRTNRFTDPSNIPHQRAASQPPRSSSDQPFLSSPTIPSRSPWSSQHRLLSPIQPVGGIPVPMSSRSASFSHQPSSASTSSSYFASAMRDRQFASTFEDDESEELADDPSAMIGRLTASAYDDGGYDDETFGTEPSSYNPPRPIGGGRLPPSLSSSISPSMLSTPANPMSRGRTYAPDLSRSRSQSLATATVARPLPIGAGASYGGAGGGGGYGGYGSAISSWNGDEGYLSGAMGMGGGRFGDIKPPGRLVTI